MNLPSYLRIYKRVTFAYFPRLSRKNYLSKVLQHLLQITILFYSIYWCVINIYIFAFEYLNKWGCKSHSRFVIILYLTWEASYPSNGYLGIR